MTASGPASAPSRCWAEVDLDAIRHNASLCRVLAGPDCGIMAIVKADAYGHGLGETAVALIGEVDWFGVANLREAQRLREATRGRAEKILILGPATPGEIDALVAAGFSASVSLPEEIDACAAAAARSGKKARLHAVADTGMGRIGCLPDLFSAFLERIRTDPHCLLEGIATHFPSADEDADFTRDQIQRFRALAESTAPEPGCHIHLANSAGLIGFQAEMPFATLARPGLALYGVSPLPETAVGLRPALTWKTRVSLVREVPAGTGISYGRTYTTTRPSRVATLAAGYGDGYPRHLSGAGAEVLVGGRRCPLLGRVTMDQVVVDVSGAGPVNRGDEVVLMGRQGREEITATELAAKAGTIPWEIFTGITGRVVRTYR